MRAFQEHTSELKQQEQAWALRMTVVLGCSVYHPSASTRPWRQHWQRAAAAVLLNPSEVSQLEGPDTQRRQTESSSLELLGHIQQICLWPLLPLFCQLSQPAEYLQ